MLLTHDGRLFVVDIVLGIVKEKFEFGDFSTKSNENIMIGAAKLDQSSNTLVLKTEANRFYFVNSVLNCHPPLPFPGIERVEKASNSREVDFVFVSRQDSKSKQIELIVTDPVAGIHICKDKESRSEYLQFRTDLIDEDHSSVG